MRGQNAGSPLHRRSRPPTHHVSGSAPNVEIVADEPPLVSRTVSDTALSPFVAA
jgi:hypothetical protein